MPTATTVRRITPPTQKNFGKIYDVFPVPDLTEIQTAAMSDSFRPTSSPKIGPTAASKGSSGKSSRSRATTRR